MGEIADDIIDGFYDELTGEVIDGESPGYPRTKQPNLIVCPLCLKKCKGQQGLKDHTKAKHKEETHEHSQG